MEHKSFTRDNYITIQGFMITELGLSGNELIAFALIHGFSQDGVSHFHGSLAYLATALNVTKQNAKKILDRLVEKKLIRKREYMFEGVKHCDYKSVVMEDSYQNDNKGGAEKVSERCLFDNAGVAESATNNKDNINNNINNNIYNTEKSVEDIIEEKRAKLRAVCEPYIPKYGKQMIDAFVEYWGEANGKRLRWEVKKAESGAFEFSRRLSQWAQKNYGGRFVPQPKAQFTPQPAPQPKPTRTPWEEMGLTQEEYNKIIVNG